MLNALSDSTDCLRIFKSPHHVTICMEKYVCIYMNIYLKNCNSCNAGLVISASLTQPVRNKSCPVKCELYTHMHVTMMIIFWEWHTNTNFTVTWSSVDMGLVYPMPLTIICTYQSLYSMLLSNGEWMIVLGFFFFLSFLFP